MEEPSTDKTMKVDTADHPPSDAETSVKAAEASAGEVAAENVPAGPAAAEEEEKKKTKVMRIRMTPEHIERALSVRVGTRPIPTLPEEKLDLAGMEDEGYKGLLDSIRNNMAEAAAAVYASREQTRLDQHRIRAQLQTMGYAEYEYEYEVTDDDDDEGDI